MVFENGSFFPLSEAQKGVYLAHMEQPDSDRYNTAFYCELDPRIDLELFTEAIQKAAKLHPAIFTTVVADQGMPQMKYNGAVTVAVLRTGATDLNEKCRVFVRPFDLENGPLYRFEICTIEEKNYLFFDFHHIISDGTSIHNLLKEIVEIYNGGVASPETYTIFEEALTQNDPVDNEKRASALSFFDEVLGGSDLDSKPVPDRMLDDGEIGNHAVIYNLTPDETKMIETFSKKNGVRPSAVFISAFAYTLAKFNGTAETAFTTANHGRQDPRIKDCFGMFVKTPPLHFNINENQKTIDFISETQHVFRETIRNDQLSFEELASRYGVSLDVSFVFQGNIFSGFMTKDGAIRPRLIPLSDVDAALQCMVFREDESYRIHLYLQKEFYTVSFGEDFMEMFLFVLHNLLTVDTLGEISFVTDDAWARLVQINQTESPYCADKTVIDLFREQVEKTPDNICAVYLENHYTYREIDEITDRLAKHLVVNCGVGKEKVVGVLIPRNEYMVICSLGVLKAGGAYLPLDPTYPPERLNLMMQDSGAMVLIYDTQFSDVITDDFAGMRMSTDQIPSLDAEAELPTPAPEDLFVMLYTSGSTGTPKGVMFQHSNMVVTSEWVKKYFSINTDSRVTAYSSYGFDAHSFDLYSAVTSGAQLHVIPDSIRLDFPALRKYYNENGITHTVMTTQIGRQFALMGGLTSLCHLSVGGEKLTPLDPPAGLKIHNLYGPTEGSVISSAFDVDRFYKDVPIGKAVDNLKTYVVDKSGRLLPPGAVGELWIAGPHVTRGYLNRPEKTVEAYGENPFEKVSGYERIYRTGDIVRLSNDGNLQFVGRRDAQVKVRGFRVELTEIEEVIRRFDGVTDATVAAFDDPAGGKYIAAYLVSDQPIDPAALADFIRAEKPPYMVPAVTMQLDKIPLNQNGKVNKRALPVPERKFENAVPPQNDLQQRIFDVIADVIGHKSFGIHTDIYDAGLSSIGAVRLNVMLGEMFEVPFKIADIKANPTVEKLEKFIGQTDANAEKHEILNEYPISKTQSGIFVECMTDPTGTSYNIPALFRLDNSVDLQQLKNAVCRAVDAHPYMKAILFTNENGDVFAKRQDNSVATVSMLKTDMLPPQSALLRPHSLLDSPLYRIEIYETQAGNYLYLDFHHIICDGTSVAILLRDIDLAYFGKTLKTEKYTGFEAALDEATARESNSYKNAETYWQKLLAGCETNCLPLKAPESERAVAGNFKFTTESSDAVLTEIKQKGFSANAYFNAAFAFVLSRFANKESVTYTTIYNGRNDSRLADAFTMLVKTLPVCAEPDGEQNTADFIQEIQEQLIDSMSNDLYSFAEIAANYHVTSDILFIYQGADFTFEQLCGAPSECITLASEDAKSPLSINIYLRNDHFEFNVEYRKDYYRIAFIESLVRAIWETVKCFATAEKLKDISMLSEYGEQQYGIMNRSESAVRPLMAHQLFEECAQNYPDKTAVVAAGKSLSFQQLNLNANRLAHALLKFGIGRDTIIGLVLDRTVEILVAQLGILKAGGAFLPMIPTYPDERIEYCLTDSESPFVITTAAICAAKPELFSTDKPYQTLILEELAAEENDENPKVKIAPDQLAYCIYTSGSTGTPKGVMIEHHAFSNFIQTDCHAADYYLCKDYDGAGLAISSISFDMSLFELYLPLCHGKTVCIATEEEIHNPMDMKNLMLNHNIQMMVCTPSYMNNLVSYPEFLPALKNMKGIVVGAEAFPGALYETLRQNIPDLQIINGYGPTECTICCSYKELHSAKGITIGRPTGNMKFFVCDTYGHVLPPYAVGELIICGDGVSRGYVKLPEKNAASFYTLRGLHAYHSGDLVRLNADAEIEFGGRIDNQVKLRGFRVELDEIEKVMCSFESVKQSKVLVRNNGTEDYLVGFYLADRKVDPEELTAYMKTKLTYYMVPAALMQLDQMPLTPNGKIDKNGFPEVEKPTTRKTGKRAAKKSLEQRLCEIFAKVLGRDEVFADDNFFELGGTSLTASKVTMILMSENIEVKYGDIFDQPTPEELAEFIEKRDRKPETAVSTVQNETKSRPALQKNTVKYAHEVKREPLGNVLLTGAVGFLGIHILNELIKTETGHIWCLVRKGSHESAEVRLKAMLVYYFSDGFEEAFRNRISLIDADITDNSLQDVLSDVPFDTVINCAACVKHFSDNDILEQINVRGVENLIKICRAKDARLIQISTVSIPGIHTPETYEKQIKMHENELFVVDDMSNKYVISKYHAELRMFDAIENGLRGKVIRVGNLMGRHSDGEFQANMETNMFLSGIRGFATMKKYPISHMTDPMSFSPIDCTAKAVVLLSGVNDQFTAFNANSRYGFDEMKIIDACNRNGIPIAPEADEIYYAEYNRKLADDSVNAKLNGLAAYDIKDAHMVDTDNLFTTNILYRIGFSWPLIDDTYLDRAIYSIMTLDYFDLPDEF